MYLYIYLWDRKEENAGSVVCLARFWMTGPTKERKARQALTVIFRNRKVHGAKRDELEVFSDNWTPRYDLQRIVLSVESS